jgi:hypothetical protein
MERVRLARWQLEKALEEIRKAAGRKRAPVRAKTELELEFSQAMERLEILPRPWWDRRGRM